MKKVELLAPAGSYPKLVTALHFGADAVYLGGKNFGLRAFADNFEISEIESAVKTCRALGKKVYVTVNIFAKNSDFGALGEFVSELARIGVDALIVSDAGVVSYVKKRFPSMEIHLSTQANTLNSYAAEFWRDEGVKRIVLARELSLEEIGQIKDKVKDTVEIEVFVHGAMCVSYSGRCLLSTYLTPRDSNRGECAQACRWEYKIGEVSRKESLTLQEDRRGSYILNSKDMDTMPILDSIINTGADALKIEGRMKSEYYVGSVVRAYRKRIDDFYNGLPYDGELDKELRKVNHRDYSTGFYLGEAGQCYETSKPVNEYRFCAEVVGYDEQKGMLEVIQRNRFFDGDTLETVSVTPVKSIRVNGIFDENGQTVSDCRLVEQRLFIKTDARLRKYDMLRKKCDTEGVC
jgi:putative protease